MGLQPHLILKVLHRILIFSIIISSKIAPPDLANFLRLCLFCGILVYFGVQLKPVNTANNGERKFSGLPVKYVANLNSSEFNCKGCHSQSIRTIICELRSDPFWLKFLSWHCMISWYVIKFGKLLYFKKYKFLLLNKIY